MPTLSTCLWFNTQAEEAARFYVSIFKRSKIITVTRYGDAAAKASGQPKGSVMAVLFRLAGREFLALNGGPAFGFTPAISIIVYGQTQKEIDSIWKKLSADPKQEQCGWLKDRYGLSWQIVPKMMVAKLLKEKPNAKTERMMAAVMRMKKLNIAELKKAYKSQ